MQKVQSTKETLQLLQFPLRTGARTERCRRGNCHFSFQHLCTVWFDFSQEMFCFHCWKFDWSIVDLQCSDHFCCTVRWFSCTCAHIPSPWGSFPTSIVTAYGDDVSRSLLANHSLYLRVYMCQSQTPSPPFSIKNSFVLFIFLQRDYKIACEFKSRLHLFQVISVFSGLETLCAAQCSYETQAMQLEG